jgi:hypothetical protein
MCEHVRSDHLIEAATTTPSCSSRIPCIGCFRLTTASLLRLIDLSRCLDSFPRRRAIKPGGGSVPGKIGLIA